MKNNSLWSIVRQTYSQWSADKASRMAAAMAYYTVFALAPLLVVAVTIAGVVFGRSSAQSQVVSQLQQVLGSSTTDLVRNMLNNYAQTVSRSGLLPTIIAAATALLAASGVVGAIKGVLNDLWRVQPKPIDGLLPSLINNLKQRLVYLIAAVGAGLVLLLALVLSTALSTVSGFVSNLLPGSLGLWRGANYLLTFILITASTTLIFKLLPDVRIRWHDAIIGAVVSTLLFTIGQFAISIYLARSSASSIYGAAGSVVVLLLWIYYSMQVFFMGAVFTYVYANRRGSGVHPSPNAYRTARGPATTSKDTPT